MFLWSDARWSVDRCNADGPGLDGCADQGVVPLELGSSEWTNVAKAGARPSGGNGESDDVPATAGPHSLADSAGTTDTRNGWGGSDVFGSGSGGAGGSKR